MKGLVVYDSVFGNTAQVARAIAEGLGAEAVVKQVAEAKPEDLVGLTTLVVGSPTRAFRPTPAMTAWLKGLPAGKLHGVKVAGFDTRIDPQDIKAGLLRSMVNLFGYAAAPISKRLVQKGGVVAMAPEGFFVTGTEGPLKDGELARAAEWGRKIAA